MCTNKNVIIINKYLIYNFAMLNCFQIEAGAFQHSQKVVAPELQARPKVYTTFLTSEVVYFALRMTEYDS